MKCRHVHKNIDRWLDRHLRMPLKKEFELHVQTCSSCQRELEMAKTLEKALRLTPVTIEPSADFDAVFWRKVYEREKTSWLSKILDSFQLLIPIPNFSQAFVVLTLAFLIGSAGGWFSASGSQVSNFNQRPAPSIQTLSGFQEYKGIPSPSIAGTYLTMVDERNLS